MGQKHLALSWGERAIKNGGRHAKIRGVYLVPRSGKISHVMAQSGLFRLVQTAALSQATQGRNGIVILSSHHGDSAPARGSVPLTATTVVHLSDGGSLPLRGLILDYERHTIHYILVGTRPKATCIPYSQVQKIASGSPSINLTHSDLENLPIFRPDDEAERNAIASLADSEPSDGGAFSATNITVQDGTGLLSGNVRLHVQKTQAEEAIRRTTGVLNVENALVTDWDLRITIAESLAKESVARNGMVSIKSSLGHVSLTGYLPSLESIERTAVLAAAVPGVQSIKHNIEARLSLEGEPQLAMVAGQTAASGEDADPGESGLASTP